MYIKTKWIVHEFQELLYVFTYHLQERGGHNHKAHQNIYIAAAHVHALGL